MSASHRRELEIAEVLARHGMVYLVDILGLGRLLSLEQSLLGGGPRMQSHAPPEELRSALEELGPTFITLGQLTPRVLTCSRLTTWSSLAKLQDAAPRVPAQVVQDVAGRELQRVEIQLRDFRPRASGVRVHRPGARRDAARWDRGRDRHGGGGCSGDRPRVPTRPSTCTVWPSPSRHSAVPRCACPTRGEGGSRPLRS
jgi:hypothetical protein